MERGHLAYDPAVQCTSLSYGVPSPASNIPSRNQVLRVASPEHFPHLRLMTPIPAMPTGNIYLDMQLEIKN